MEKIDFDFIKDAVLRENIKNVYDDISELLAMMTYEESRIEKLSKENHYYIYRISN